ncbi:RNA-binding S4 domain-containing protein [Andreprevotia chitinilytica]|uniref:RNA-binding S4 domain-containing protein n=1 Tax=Andreprevotia chitinilytica TaxID=396808 RepID=UPI000552424D|nr:RNA-binding S4 domain-containing protein [Andreprevotia chitinilytica]
MKQDTDGDKVRLDKWLWAARFFKTRTLATEAVEAGRVMLNGERPKPARALKAGDELRIRAAHGEFSVTVLQLAEKRGSAVLAQSLYVESPESIAKRELVREAQAAEPQFENPLVRGRPSKKVRRQLHDFARKQGKE